MKWLLFVLMMYSFLSEAQVIPRDTSFTVNGTFIKERKARPYIQIAEPQQLKDVKSKRNFVYNVIGTRQLLADIYYPKNKSKKKVPAVVMVFGGGWKSGDKTQNIPLAQQLALNGFVALTIEYRLSPEATYPAAVQDVKAAVRWLKANAKKYNVDTTKIATLGMSAGGQLAALVGTTNGLAKFEGNGSNLHHSSNVQAIVNIDGTLAFKHPESVEGKVAGEWLGGMYEERADNWEEAAPLNHVDKNTPPILFINSSITRFHAGRDDMIKQLHSLNIYSEVHTLADTPHPFWFFHPWFNTVVSTTVQFLNKVFL